MLTLPKSWDRYLWQEVEKKYFQDILRFLDAERMSCKLIYPQESEIFNAFELTDFEDVSVVILWQDPYHGKGQAHGLSFSVPGWMKIPPSLRNIYKEIESDILRSQSLTCKEASGNLTSWAEQWVLLLNSCLTVEHWKPASHSKIWWQIFTDQVIKTISDRKEHVVFLLWGAFAQTKKHLIDTSKHYVLETTHPSPFSAYRWFLWSQHFSKTNNYLESKGKEGIHWGK